jgi:hypothetical protein
MYISNELPEQHRTIIKGGQMEDKADKQAQFIELRAKGNSFDRIADKLKISKTTLINWSKAHKQEVNNMTAIERDALMDRYQMAKRHQLEMYGEQLAKVKEEVSKRNMSDVSTEKLVTMEIKLLDAVNSLGISVILEDKDGGWSDLDICSKWEA